MVDVMPNVREFMDKSFITLTPDMDVYRAIDVMLKGGITGAAVVDTKDRLVGILSEKDCLRTLVHGAYSGLPSGKVSDFMSPDPETIHADLDVFSVRLRDGTCYGLYKNCMLNNMGDTLVNFLIFSHPFIHGDNITI
jgi:CBS domain-containing protein